MSPIQQNINYSRPQSIHYHPCRSYSRIVITRRIESKILALLWAIKYLCLSQALTIENILTRWAKSAYSIIRRVANQDATISTRKTKMAREAASPRHQTVLMHVTCLGSRSIKPSEAINVLHFAQICGLTSFCRESRRSPSAYPTSDKSSTFSGRRSGASSCSSKCQRQTMASSTS